MLCCISFISLSGVSVVFFMDKDNRLMKNIYRYTFLSFYNTKWTIILNKMMDDYSKLDQSETGFCENTFRGRSGLCVRKRRCSLMPKLLRTEPAECSTSRQASPGRLFVIMNMFIYFFYR